MRSDDKHDEGLLLLVGTKDRVLGRIFSMVIICILAGLLVGFVASGLKVVSIWVMEIRDWPIGKAAIVSIVALWFWCAFIYPVYCWFRYKW